ncbi:MAG: nucleotidyltransferase domain-containing protein [Prolixibacteraceae bacterium]
MDKVIILRDLKDSLKKQYPDSVKNVILFGSQAKGIANENSDFDILILLDKDYSGSDENNILDICYEIDLKYNIIIDAHLLSLKELSTIRGKQPVFMNAINSGIYA